jgi:hypothetical protein
MRIQRHAYVDVRMQRDIDIYWNATTTQLYIDIQIPTCMPAINVASTSRCWPVGSSRRRELGALGQPLHRQNTVGRQQLREERRRGWSQRGEVRMNMARFPVGLQILSRADMPVSQLGDSAVSTVHVRSSSGPIGIPGCRVSIDLAIGQVDQCGYFSDGNQSVGIQG